jgi:polyisoprenoid-binding protein YceI
MSSAAPSPAPAPGAAPTPEVHRVDRGHSEVSFQVRHLVSKVRGRFTDFDAEIRIDRARPERSRVRFTVQAASIDTDLPDRDAHLRGDDFLDADRHPQIVFESRSIAPAGDNVYTVHGDLEIRGVSKPIDLSVEFLGFVRDPWGNEKAGFETSVRIPRKDFGMVWNAVLDNGGVILGDEVLATINLETIRDKTE